MCEISVIIPVYNSNKFLRKTIESILKQSFKDFEIIIVDDGSTNLMTNKICEFFRNKDSRITIINNNRNGIEKSRLTGIENSKGKYLVFSDHDDIYVPNALEILYNTIKTTDTDIVIADCKHKYIHIFNNFKIIKSVKDTLVVEREEFLQNHYANFFGKNSFPVATWGKIYKKDLINVGEIKTFGFNFMEDVILNCQFFESAQKVAFISNKVYIHFFGGLSSKYDPYKVIDGYFSVYHFRIEKLKSLELNNKIWYVHEELKNVICSVLRNTLEVGKSKMFFFELSNYIRNHVVFNEIFNLLPKSEIVLNIYNLKHEDNYELFLKNQNYFKINSKKLVKKIFDLKSKFN